MTAFWIGVVVGAGVFFIVVDHLPMPKTWPAVRSLVQGVAAAALLYFMAARVFGWPLPFET